MPHGEGSSRTSAGALVPVAPVRTGAGTPLPGPGPLDGSGVGLLELLATEDALLARPDTEPVALEVGLERARGALLRQMPTDALASLDAVWEGARRTEEGWYLRGGALLALGLPGEGDRVVDAGVGAPPAAAAAPGPPWRAPRPPRGLAGAGDRVVDAGVDARPASNALRFLQSLTRLALGDLAGAREALGAAQRRLPADPLLLSQLAVLAARGGDSTRADELLHAAARRLPQDHPVLEYARDSVRSSLAARRREGSIPMETRAGDAPAHVARDAGEAAVADVGASAPPRPPAAAEGTADVEVTLPPGRDVGARDPISQAVHLLGGRLAGADATRLEREARALLAALSAGGALAGSAPAPQLHGARALLVTMLSVLAGEECDATPVFRTLVESVLGAMRAGAPDEAARVLRRTGAVTREPTMALLHELVRGALVAVQRTPGTRAPDPLAALATGGGVGAGFGGFDGAVRGDVERSVLLPLRLGLRLLDESRESRSALRGTGDAERRARSRDADAPGDTLRPEGSPFSLAPTLSSVRAVAASPGSWAEIEPVASHVGAAHGGPLERPTAPLELAEEERERLERGRPARLIAMACVLLAAVAGTTGHPAFAVAFGVGAAWLAVRRSTGDSATEQSGDEVGRVRVERSRPATVVVGHDEERIG